MRKALFLIAFSLVVPSCSSYEEQEANLQQIQQPHKMAGISNVSYDDRFVLTEAEEISAIFQNLTNSSVGSILTLVYANMYATQNHFINYLQQLRDVDPDGEMSFGALKSVYLSYSPNDPTAQRARYHLMMLSTFMLATSSVDFFEKEAFRQYDACDSACSEWQAITSANAVRGLYRLGMAKPSTRPNVRDAFFRIISSPDVNDQVTLETMEILISLGMPKQQAVEMLPPSKSHLNDYQWFSVLPEPQNNYYDSEKPRHYGSPDPAPEVGELP